MPTFPVSHIPTGWEKNNLNSVWIERKTTFNPLFFINAKYKIYARYSVPYYFCSDVLRQKNVIDCRGVNTTLYFHSVIRPP